MLDIEIEIVDRRLHEAAATERGLRRAYGQNAKLMARRLKSLQVAPALADMSGVPGRCHALTENRKGQFAVSLWGPYRLILECDHEPPPLTEDGGIDPTRVTRIRVLEVENYHGN